MKPTIGFLPWSFRNAAASSSADPPISPIMIDRHGCRDPQLNNVQHVDEVGAVDRVAADPNASD